MTTRVIVGIVAFVCGVVCAITGTEVVFEMVDRVNEGLPEERQFSPLWWLDSHGAFDKILDHAIEIRIAGHQCYPYV